PKSAIQHTHISRGLTYTTLAHISIRPGNYSVELLPFRRKSGGLSTTLPSSMVFEGRFATRGFLVSFGHLETALQAKCESRLDVVKGGNGMLTAQPASMIIAAAAAENLMMLGLPRTSRTEISI